MKTAILKLNDTGLSNCANEAARILKAGGTVAFPTDTVYGLGAIYSDAEAVKKIFMAKERPQTKPLSILVSDISQVRMLAADISDEAYKLMQAFWPGALTIILRKNEHADIPDEVSAGGDTIGVRMPDSKAALKLIEAAGSPLAAPSANISGERSARIASEVIDDLDGRIDMILDGGDCPIGISSTIADMSGGSCRILRVGSISEQEIQKVLSDLSV